MIELRNGMVLLIGGDGRCADIDRDRGRFVFHGKVVDNFMAIRYRG